MRTDIVVPLAFFVSVAFIVVGLGNVIANGRLRRQLLQSNASPELARAVMAPTTDLGLYGALKWGLVLGAVGLALIVVQFMPYRPDEPIVYGTVLLFAAAGLLTYYAMGRRVGRAVGVTPAV